MSNPENPYREMSFMAYVFDFLVGLDVGGRHVFSVHDPISRQPADIAVSRSAISKASQRLGFTIRTRLDKESGNLVVVRLR